jgi:hypothetical protein
MFTTSFQMFQQNKKIQMQVNKVNLVTGIQVFILLFFQLFCLILFFLLLALLGIKPKVLWLLRMCSNSELAISPASEIF